MNDQELSGNEKPKELEYAEQLVHESKFAEASQILTELVKNEKTPLSLRISGYLLQSRIFILQAKYNDCYKVAELVYKESLRYKKDIRTVEALNRMSLSMILTGNFDKGIQLVQKAENLLKTFPKVSSPRYCLMQAFIASNKGYYYYYSLKNLELGLKYFEESLSLRKKHGDKIEIAMGFYGFGSMLRLNGEFDRAIENFTQGLTFAKKSGNKYPILMILQELGTLHVSKGEVDQAIEFFEEGLEYAKEINNNHLIWVYFVRLGETFSLKGEYDRALTYFEQGMEISDDNENLIGGIIKIYLAKNNFEQAHKYYKRLEQLKDHDPNDRILNLRVLFYNALLLKASPRFRNKIEAEEKLRKILEEGDLGYYTEKSTLIHLSDLLLNELYVTNETEILDEIRPLVARLQELAEKSNSYLDLCEVYLLQAKLALIDLNIKKAQRLLFQAEQIAKKFNLAVLIRRISNDTKDLNEKLDLWEQIKETEAPIIERLSLIRLDQHIANMIQKSSLLTAQIKEEKIAIQKERKICLVCRSDVLRFSYICDCGVIYCDNCARALTDLENVCWACNEPIDYSKPIKPYKKKEIVKFDKEAKNM